MLGNKIKLSIPQILVTGYFLLIVIGSILLWLPIAHSEGVEIHYLDALFTTVSATCVTGLIAVDTGTSWSLFGKIVIISLIQIGGLGILAFITVIQMTMRQTIGLRQRLAIQQDLNSFDLKRPEKLIGKVILISLGIEAIGAIVLSTQFIGEYGIGTGIWYGVFHSISAFCNAGFDLFGNFQSLTLYQHNPIILYTIMGLIIAGGLGFIVWTDIASFFSKKMKSRLSFHTKIVLITTVALLVLGAIGIGLIEYNGVALAGLSPLDKVHNILFMAITPRTAGFSNINLSDMRLATSLITIVLMFIGASSGSTAGGIKTTTFAVIMLALYSELRQRSSVRIFGRRISVQAVDTAFSVATIGFVSVLIGSFVLSITDSSFGLLEILFETVSAFGTVGSSMSMSPELSAIGKVVIMLLMYIGRVGPVTFGLSLLVEKKSTIRYPEGKILIG